MPAASAAPGGLKSGLGICRNAGSPLPSPYVSPGKYLLDMGVKSENRARSDFRFRICKEYTTKHS